MPKTVTFELPEVGDFIYVSAVSRRFYAGRVTEVLLDTIKIYNDPHEAKLRCDPLHSPFLRPGEITFDRKTFRNYGWYKGDK